ncbi:MAG: ATP synthase F1 subunit delta [Veillonellaceae bacterium]|nr:ATP synthase F1 subunit delta [Veillonellaceae bacterium]
MLSKPMATKLAHDLYELAGDKNFLAEAKFLLELAEKHREGALPAILREYVELAQEDKRNLMMADVTTALPLTVSQEQALAEKLAAMTGRTIKIRQHVDSGILGGIVVRVGDKLLDGSLSHQLSVLQADLLKTPLKKVGVTG